MKSLYRSLMTALICLWVVLFSSAYGARQGETKVDKKAVEVLRKDMEGIREALEKIQDRLSQVAPENGASKSSLQSTIDKVAQGQSNFILRYTEDLSQRLKRRLQEFLYGIDEIARALMTPVTLQRTVKAHFLVLTISLAISLFSVVLGRAILRRDVLIVPKKLAGHSFNQLALMIIFMALPLAGCFFLSVLTSFILEYFHVIPLQPESRLKTFSALLPFNIYALWMGVYGTRLVLSPARPSQAMIPVNPYGAHRGAFWIRLAFVCYFLGTSLLAVIEIFPLSERMIKTVLDTMTLIICASLLHGFLVLRDHLIPGAYTRQVARVLTILRWVIFGLCGVWLIDRSLFNQLLVQIMVTCVTLVLRGPIESFIRRTRIKCLWKRRHHTFLLKSFLISSRGIKMGVRGALYTFIGLTWIRYLWRDYDYTHMVASITTWGAESLYTPIATHLLESCFILGGAFLLTRGAMRLLKYYIEEKYSQNTAENNFLASRLKTLMAVLKTFVRAIIWVPTIGLILARLWDSHHLTALLTSVGAASFGLSFGFNEIVKDCVTGFLLILENNLMVGDQVDVDGRSGVVEAIALRTLKIRTDNGTLLTIPFSKAAIIGNKNRTFSAVVLGVSVGYSEDVEKVQNLIERAFTNIKKIPGMSRRIISPLEIRGVTEVTAYSMVIQAKLRTLPGEHEIVRRALIKSLKKLFDEANIKIPLAPWPSSNNPSLTNTGL